MNKLVLVITVLVASVSAQFGFGNQGNFFEGRQTGLNAGDRSFLSANNGLFAGNANQDRLDAASQFGSRLNNAAAANRGDRLASNSAIDAASFDDRAAFNNLAVKDDVSSANRLALTLVDENRFDRSQGLASSNGAQFNSGDRLSAADNLAAESVGATQFANNEQVFDNNALSAANAGQNQLQALENLNAGTENVLGFNDLRQNQFAGGNQGFNNGGFGNGGFGNGGFGNGGFGNGGFGNGGFGNGGLGNGIFGNGLFGNGGFGGR